MVFERLANSSSFPLNETGPRARLPPSGRRWPLVLYHRCTGPHCSSPTCRLPHRFSCRPWTPRYQRHTLLWLCNLLRTIYSPRYRLYIRLTAYHIGLGLQHILFPFCGTHSRSYLWYCHIGSTWVQKLQKQNKTNTKQMYIVLVSSADQSCMHQLRRRSQLAHKTTSCDRLWWVALDSKSSLYQTRLKWFFEYKSFFIVSETEK